MSTTTKKTAARKTTKRTSTTTKAKATPKKQAEPKVKKSDIPEDQRDYTYLAEKEPTDLHEDMADWILEVTGYEPESKDDFLKAVQATAVLRMVYQRSERNKKRTTYRGLDETVVEQRSVHMIQAHQAARKEREKREQEVEAKKKAAAAKRAASRKRTTKKSS